MIDEHPRDTRRRAAFRAELRKISQLAVPFKPIGN
jgi:hypothetical protein